MRITVPGLGEPLEWTAPPAAVRPIDGGFAITAAPRTDIFVDPQTDQVTATAPLALAPAPDGDFQLSARVGVGFGEKFDAGALLVWHDERHSAKLCFEFSDRHVPTVVSVVTRGVSDDANGWSVTGDEVWLRLSRIGASWAMHASADGVLWAMVRSFRLESALPARVGLLAQSPLGDGATARFTELNLVHRTLADLRDGT